MNYQQLLKKYMKHVGEEEGIHFVPTVYDKEFSEEERLELDKISKEIYDRCYNEIN